MVTYPVWTHKAWHGLSYSWFGSEDQSSDLQAGFSKQEETIFSKCPNAAWFGLEDQRSDLEAGFSKREETIFSKRRNAAQFGPEDQRSDLQAGFSKQKETIFSKCQKAPWLGPEDQRSDLQAGFSKQEETIFSKHWNAPWQRIFKARGDFFSYIFQIKKDLLWLAFWQRRAPSLVFATPRQFYPKVIRKVEKPHPTTGTPNNLIHHNNSSPHTTRAQFTLQSRPCPTWLLAIPPSEGQTGCNKFVFRLAGPQQKCKFKSWEVSPNSDHHRAFTDWLRQVQLCTQYQGKYFQGMS